MTTRTHLWTCGRRSATAMAVCVLVIAAVPLTAAADPRPSEEVVVALLEAERQTRVAANDLNDVRADVEVAEQTLAEIGRRLEHAEGRLTAVEGQIQLAEAGLERANRTEQMARERHLAAVVLLDRTEVQLADAEARFVAQVVGTFKHGSSGAARGTMVLEALRRAEDPNAFATGMQQLRVVIIDQDATVQQIFELRDQRRRLSDEASRARRQSIRATEDANHAVDTLGTLHLELQAVAAEVALQHRRQRRILAELNDTEAELTEARDDAAERQARLREDLLALRRVELTEAGHELSEVNLGGLSDHPGVGGAPLLDDMLCPVVGAVVGRDVIDDWGFPRSDARRHEGNDIFAPRGTSVVAVQDALVVGWNPPDRPSRLGGLTVTYQTTDGSRWYNAHLDTIEPGIEPGVEVSRGDQIGTVGTTGNARSTPPHLHLGRRYDGTPVNPWPSLLYVCP